MSIITALRGLLSWNELELEVLNEDVDHPLIQKHSTDRQVTVDGKSVKLRTLALPHHNGHKLPQLPLVLFIHGLGGQLSQFEPLIDYFSHFATIFSLDLPGHGKSPVSYDWAVYEPDFLVRLIVEALKASIPDSEDHEIVIIGHSMGSVLAVRLAARLGIRCIGVIGICPPAEVNPDLEASRKWLKYMPAVMFDFFRSIDRQGGLHSPSVDRMVSKTASDEVRRRQLRWNLQVNTQGWMRTAYKFRAASPVEWSSIAAPLYLIGAADDKVTPVKTDLTKIVEWLGGKEGDGAMEEYFESQVITDAGHACMIEHPEKICGLIGEFINEHVENKLTLQWQLGFLASQMDKWSLKNEAKWRRTQSVSDCIPNTPFRGMKTLRQEDKEHSPTLVERKYPDITDIIDISREVPPYDPETFEHIQYHKFPTVSKIPPTRKECTEFIELVDTILRERGAAAGSGGSGQACIAVHCHYGFNRTGFFIVSYMIEKLGFSIKDAVAAWKASREPGIKHPHFIDELYVRYEK